MNLLKLVGNVILALTLTAQSAVAGDASGKVTLLIAHYSDIVMFGLDGTHGNKPACSTGQGGWALSLLTPTGKAQYALLLSAQAQGQSVNVSGAGVCDVWPDRERPLFIEIRI